MTVLPYHDSETGHSSGWAGSETSKERAHGRDLSGDTATVQAHVLDLLREREGYGLTVAEARELLSDSHHGTVSGALSNLHKVSVIFRLTEVRGGCKVYVLPKFSHDRDTEAPRRNLNVRKVAAMRRIISQAEERGLDALPLDKVKQIIEFTEKEK